MVLLIRRRCGKRILKGLSGVVVRRRGMRRAVSWMCIGRIWGRGGEGVGERGGEGLVRAPNCLRWVLVCNVWGMRGVIGVGVGKDTAGRGAWLGTHEVHLRVRRESRPWNCWCMLCMPDGYAAGKRLDQRYKIFEQRYEYPRTRPSS
jgi:hypothetical protein